MNEQRGQILILFAFLMIAVLGLMALSIDGALYFAHWQGLQTDLDAACVAAGAHKVADPFAAFAASLATNGVTESAGIYPGADNTWITWAEGPHEIYLAQFMGITTMDISVESRCLIARAGTPPIVVREDWYIQSRDFGIDFPIFGHGAEALDAQGSDFRGAALPHMWCEDANGNVSDQCEVPVWFDPVGPATNINQYKFIIEDLIKKEVGSPWVPPGTRIAHIAGVSNNPTIHAMEDAGYVPGDRIVVMIFDGVVTRPDSNPRENVEILYYAEAEITMFDSNTMFAKFVGPPLLDLGDVLGLTQPRVVPMSWAGSP